jgi:hypothetical protein
MKKQYDFSRGERGKFYRPNVKVTLPTCAHEHTHRGDDAPRRWGTYQTQVCDACGMFRLLTHSPQAVASDWKPAAEYADAVADQELD